MTLETLRERIAALQEERKQVERAPPSRDEAAAGIAEAVELLAKQGRDKLNPWHLRRGKVDVDWGLQGRGVLAIHAALDPERLERRLLEIALDEYPEPGITAPDRKRRLAEIDAELLRLQIEEERLIRSSATPIIRRPDALPEIVLAPELDAIAA